MKLMTQSIFLFCFSPCILLGCAAVGSGSDNKENRPFETGSEGTDAADLEIDTDTEDKSSNGHSGSGGDSDEPSAGPSDNGSGSHDDGTHDDWSDTEEDLGSDGSSDSQSHGSGDSGGGDDTDSSASETCIPRTQVECYDGPPQTKGVSHCHAGHKTCSDDGKSYGDCAGQSLPKEIETCDLTDENCDGWIDNLHLCPPCLRPQPYVVSQYPWQEHTAYGQQCYPAVVSPKCVVSEYNYAISTPAPGDSDWKTHSSVDINWSVPTNGLLLGCHSGHGCAGGGQFTYFQTFFYLGRSYAVSDARVSIANVDDGVRITLYNDMYPNGIVVPGGYMCQNGIYTTDNFSSYLAKGYNRIVMTQLDDCPHWSALQGVKIKLNSIDLVACIPGQWGGESL